MADFKSERGIRHKGEEEDVRVEESGHDYDQSVMIVSALKVAT